MLCPAKASFSFDDIHILHGQAALSMAILTAGPALVP
jgi:hypothetical protein